MTMTVETVVTENIRKSENSWSKCDQIEYIRDILSLLVTNINFDTVRYLNLIRDMTKPAK